MVLEEFLHIALYLVTNTTKINVILQGRGMSSQPIQPNLTMRTMQLNALVADSFINDLHFSTSYTIMFLP